MGGSLSNGCSDAEQKERAPGQHAEVSRRPPATPVRLSPATLRCTDVIDQVEAPPVGYTIARGGVALSTGSDGSHGNQVSEDPHAEYGARLFAKFGLLVQAGAALELVVPEEDRPAMSVGWGHGAARTWELRAPPCIGTGRWNVFAGGIWVEDRGCYAIVVRAAGREELLRIGVGSPCPGGGSPERMKVDP